MTILRTAFAIGATVAIALSVVVLTSAPRNTTDTAGAAYEADYKLTQLKMTCGPAITQVLDNLVRKHLWKPVHMEYNIVQDVMTVDGVFAAGQVSYRVIAHCSVDNGKANVGTVEM